MRRILQIITKSELGGAQSHVADLLEGLDASGVGQYELHVAASVEGPLLERARAAGASVHLLPRLQRSVNPIADMAAVRECAALIRRVRPDLVHAHSSKAGVVARLAGRRTGTPVVFTAHGWGFSPGAPRARQLLARAIETALSPLCARIICVCEADRQRAIGLRVASPGKLATIHNGISPEAEQARPETQPPRFIMVARFSEQKDQTTLLHALSLLERDGKTRDFGVDLVGTGPDFEKLQALSQQLRLDGRVQFLGDRHDVPALLAASQAFVLSTHYEGLPISIMEAMRAGLPTIATDVSGIPEEVEHEKTGLLTPPRDAPALARALETLLESPPRRAEMGQAARRKFEREFTRARMLREVEQLYRDVLERHR